MEFCQFTHFRLHFGHTLRGNYFIKILHRLNIFGSFSLSTICLSTVKMHILHFSYNYFFLTQLIFFSLRVHLSSSSAIMSSHLIINSMLYMNASEWVLIFFSSICLFFFFFTNLLSYKSTQKHQYYIFCYTIDILGTQNILYTYTKYGTKILYSKCAIGPVKLMFISRYILYSKLLYRYVLNESSHTAQINGLENVWAKLAVPSWPIFD